MSGLLLLPAIDLAAVDVGAALQTRADRKYVVGDDTLDELLGRLLDPLTEPIGDGGQAHVLEIDGRRTFHYRSVYFDTPELDAYLATARRRRSRCKVRIRTYVDTGTSWLEVKQRDGRGRTVKHRIATSGPSALGPAEVAHLATFGAVAPVARRLGPTLTTTYRRSTLVVDGGRITIDSGVRGTSPDGRVACVDGHVVETKSHRPGGPVDRALWELGVRPIPLSKYGTALAALRADLPANRWHRTLARHVVVDEPIAAEPAGAPLNTNVAGRGRARPRS